MSKFNFAFTDSLKQYLIRESIHKSALRKYQDELILNSIKGKNLESSSNIESFIELPINKDEFFNKCFELLEYMPIQNLRNKYITNIKYFKYEKGDFLMNYGERIFLNEEKDIVFEEWRNIIEKNKKDNILLSLHKRYNGKKYEIKLSIGVETSIIEINFTKTENIDNVKFTELIDKNKTFYLISISQDKKELNTYLYYDNGEKGKGKIFEEKKERLVFFFDYNKVKEIDDMSDIPITVTELDSETFKEENPYNYNEKSNEIMKYDPKTRSAWGQKSYQNNQKRKYNEDWKRFDFSYNGYEEKVHKFLDDGKGKQTTEDFGKRKPDKNSTDYEWADKYEYNVTNGDELTTKTGFDKYNKWKSYNFRNRIKNFSHVVNEASNSLKKMEWNEKWDEVENVKYCKKWGRSEDEEWEESWKETYDPKSDNSMKDCYKKCKKLKEDKEWYETWTEKNNGKPNCEKTCYKMNRVGKNKYENYWGNIIVNYLDNKRMNYVGYINNDQKKEYINYTYKNTDN